MQLNAERRPELATQTVKPTDHKLLVAGEWSEGSGWQEVESPYEERFVTLQG